MVTDANRFLERLIENLADIESNLHSYDYREAGTKIAELHHNADELLNAMQREGLAVLQAEQVVDSVHAKLDAPFDAPSEPTQREGVERTLAEAYGINIYNLRSGKGFMDDPSIGSGRSRFTGQYRPK